MLLWKRKTAELEEVRAQTHATIAQTDRSIAKLNKLLRADGITLKIYKATHDQPHAQ
jgi:hypothetical protein